MVAPIVIDQRHAVFGCVHSRIIGIDRNDTSGNRLRGFCPGNVRLHIGEAHRHTQLERIGVFEPLSDIAVINTVVTAPCLGRKRRIAAQYLDGLVQLLEHLRIDRLLRVILHIDRLVAFQLRVRDRAVGIGHTVHDGHTQQAGKSDGHFVFRAVDDALIRGIGLGDNVGERPFAPVGRRIIRLELGLPRIDRSTDVTAERPARKRFVELIHMLLHRNHKTLKSFELRSGLIIQGIHLVVRNLIGIAVDVFEIAGAGCQSEQRQ